MKKLFMTVFLMFSVLAFSGAAFAKTGKGGGKPSLVVIHAVLFDGKKEIEDARLFSFGRNKTECTVTKKTTLPPPIGKGVIRNPAEDSFRTRLTFRPFVLPSGRHAVIEVKLDRSTLNWEKTASSFVYVNVGKEEMFRFSNGLSLRLTVSRVGY